MAVILAFSWRVILLVLAFSYKPEHIVNKDGKKYVAYVRAFTDVNVDYYDYINIFLRGNKKKITEWYGNGGYDPFEQENALPQQVYYLDDNKNAVKKEETSTKYYSDKNNYNTTEVEEEKEEKFERKILYEKQIDELKLIRVVVIDYIIGQRQVIEIEKTFDGGKTWNGQTNNGMMIHNGAEFIFIDENLGFINDLGLAGTEGDNRALYRTIDGGKSFKKIDITWGNEKEELYIEDVPYKEGQILKLKVYVQLRDEKVYYNLYSDDNGLNWKML